MTARFADPQTPKARHRHDRRFASLRSIGALMLREMATSYGKSPGGYLWAILEPVAGVAVLTFSFSFVFAKPPLGTSFELFYATGTLPFFMFITITNRVSRSLLHSKPLLAYPAVTYVDALIANFLVSALTELLVFYVVILGILALYDTRAVVDTMLVAQLALTALFALGGGVVNSYLFVRWHVWHVGWSVMSRPLFIISGVFFMYDALPADLKEWIWFNPLIHVVGLMRAGFYPTYSDHYVSVLYVCGVSLVLILLALRLLHWNVKWLLHET
ncbi:MAG: ABC transporter permease [Rhodobacter sp.]|nr:ABC transporter permease [Rhodobacter sp.]